MEEKLYTKAFVKEIDENERTLVAYASTETLDRDGDIIEASGWVLDNFRKNPVLLWAHRYDMPPIGKVLWVKHDGKSLKFKARFADTQMASDIWRLFKDGYLNAFSVGFIPIEMKYEERDGREVRVFKKQELLEISAVPVPANPDALVAAIEQGEVVIMSKALKDELELLGKSVVPFRSYPALPNDTPWSAAAARKRIAQWASSDGSGDKDKIKWSKYRQGFAQYDENNPENFGSYKLPHHDVRDGKLYTHPRGTYAAMAAILGARGGVNLPEKERKGAYNHIAKHYKTDLDKEPPEYREYSEAELKEMFPWVYELPEEEWKALIGDIATKEEIDMEELKALIDELREEFKKEIEGLRKEIKTFRESLKSPEASVPQGGDGDVRDEDEELSIDDIREAIKEVISELTGKEV